MTRAVLLTALALAWTLVAPTVIQTGTPPQAAPAGIYTRNADNLRDGVFQDQALTPASIKAHPPKLLTTIPVYGDARGVEAQPLITNPIPTAKGVKSVMIAASMANVVRGVDARGGADIWTAQLCRAADANPSIDMYGINQHIGVLSSGVYDTATMRAYLVAACSPDGDPARIIHSLYTLDARTGVILGQASFADLHAGSQSYTDRPRKQRSALLLTHMAGHTIIFGAHGSQSETGASWAGAVFAYDATIGKWAAYQPTTNGAQAGIWMGGGGLAELGGRLVGQTGNGDFNGVDQWGESIFGLDYTPASKSAAAAIHFATNFTPFSDRGRIGLDPTWAGAGARIVQAKPAGVNAATEAAEPSVPVGGAMEMPAKTRIVQSPDANTGGFVPLVYPAQPTKGGWNDQDLGSGGCAIVPGNQFLDGRAVAVCGGKDGLIYQVYIDRMGNTRPQDFADNHHNCSNLAAPPIWGTVWPGAVDPCPQDQTVLDFAPWGKTAHLHMTPVIYISPRDGVVMWVWGENSTLHRWRIGRDHQWHYTGESRDRASAQSTYGTGGMPGGMCALSTDSKTGTVWCSVPYGDANRTVTTGHLEAFDADAITQDADGPHLVQVWDSNSVMPPYLFNKFLPPEIWQGIVVQANYGGGVMEFMQ